MIWVCFSVCGLSSVANFSRNQNREKYGETNKKNFFSFVEEHHSDGYESMPDGTLCHGSNATSV